MAHNRAFPPSPCLPIMNTPATRGYLYAFATVLLWAGFVLLSRVAGASGLSGFDLTALRFAVAAAVLLPVWLCWKRVPLLDPRMWALAAVGGIGYPLAAYSGLQFAPAAHGAVLISGTLPFAVTLMAWWLLRERPGPRRWLALAVIAAGVGCMALHSGGDLSQSWRGDLLLLLASLLWGLYTVLVKRWRRTPWEVTIGGALLAAALYLPVYALWLPVGLGTAPLGAIALQGFFQGVMVVIVAMLFFMQAMARLGPTRLGSVMATVPAIAGLGAVLLLGEPFSWLLAAGLGLTCTGAWLGSRPG